MIVLGGTAALSENSTVSGDVFILGGTLTAAGTIQGDVAAVGGLVSLESTAQVNGDINALSASLKRAEGSQVVGEVNTEIAGPFTIDIPGNLKIPGLEGLPPISIPRELGVSGCWIPLQPHLGCVLVAYSVVHLGCHGRVGRALCAESHFKSR